MTKNNMKTIVKVSNNDVKHFRVVENRYEIEHPVEREDCLGFRYEDTIIEKHISYDVQVRVWFLWFTFWSTIRTYYVEGIDTETVQKNRAIRLMGQIAPANK